MNNIKQKEDKKQKNIGFVLYKSFKSFCSSLPVLIGVVLLLGLFRVNVSPRLISSIFRGQYFRDVLTGSLIGSISAGNPITSYIIGGELLMPLCKICNHTPAYWEEHISSVKHKKNVNRYFS